MSVVQSDEDYPHAWFVFGCAALELNEFVRATGAFRRAEKARASLSFELYQECSIWEWQALLGTLFARVAMGDIEGVKSRMTRVFEEVPPHLAQRLTSELTGALLNQNEVMLAWEIVETKLAKDALGTVPFYRLVSTTSDRKGVNPPISCAFEFFVRGTPTRLWLCRCLVHLSIAVNDRRRLMNSCGYFSSSGNSRSCVKLARDLPVGGVLKKPGRLSRSAKLHSLMKTTDRYLRGNYHCRSRYGRLYSQRQPRDGVTSSTGD